MRIISKVKTVFNIRKKFVRCLDSCHDYLRKGVYKINPSLTVVYNSNVVEKEKRVQEFLFGNSIAPNALLYFFTKFLVRFQNKDGDKFAGQIVIISTNEKNYKVFDYNTLTLISIYETVSAAGDVYEKRKKWANYFPVMDFKLLDSGKVIQEGILEKKHFDHKEMFKRIISDYSMYLKKINSTSSSIIEDYTDCFDSFIHDFILSDTLLERVINQEPLKKCITHGDLWASNIITDGNNYYYIDFENVDYRVFYYDIFMYMFSEEMILENDTLLSQFFKGELDQDMHVLFDAFEEMYNKNDRNVYFVNFLFILYSERWNGNQSIVTTQKVNHIINKYLR